MRVYDRDKESYIETEQFGGGALEFLYGNFLGRCLLWLAVSPVVSNIYAFMNSRRSSAKKIPGFIKEYDIDMSEYEDRDYSSFKDFFIRRFKEGARGVDTNENILIAPADSKLLVYDIDDDLKMQIKGRTYTIAELLGRAADLTDFKGGYALVFRLCMDDCHRYCFVDNGSIEDHYRIKGKLHTVSSFSKDHKIYKENTREISLINSEHFGEMFQIEVGALLVGRINNHYPSHFKKGEEKGFFEPGGSTIIILVKGDKIWVDSDILRHSKEGIETQVKFGEGIGKRKC